MLAWKSECRQRVVLLSQLCKTPSVYESVLLLERVSHLLALCHDSNRSLAKRKQASTVVTIERRTYSERGLLQLFACMNAW